jgi:hypothetical protein
MTRLTDTQLVILSAAAQHEGGAVLPLPNTLRINKGAATGVLKSLLRQALIAERPAARDDEAWHEEGDGRRIGLAITEAGLKAIGLGEDVAPKKVPTKDAVSPRKDGAGRSRRKMAQRAEPTPAPNGVRSGTKLALLIDLLGRKTGVSIDEIVEVTGWQAHSVRGAISGALKKKLGLAVVSEKVDQRSRVYRIATQR